MNTKEKAPSAATLEAAGAETAAFGEATFSTNDFTSGGAGRQEGKIFSLLLEGEANAIPAVYLMQLAGYKNQRSMRMEIDREREIGLPVLASDSGYYRPGPGPAGIAEVRRFLRRQDARAASNRRTTNLIRARLRAIKKAPLPGQESFFNRPLAKLSRAIKIADASD